MIDMISGSRLVNSVDPVENFVLALSQCISTSQVPMPWR